MFSYILDLFSLAKFVRKSKKKSMPTIWHIPDDLWEEFELVLPPRKPARTVGRPAVPFRKVLNGVLYVLRTGCQWKKVPKEFGSGSTCHARFQEWIGIGVFKKVWKRLLEIYVIYPKTLQYIMIDAMLTNPK